MPEKLAIGNGPAGIGRVKLGRLSLEEQPAPIDFVRASVLKRELAENRRERFGFDLSLGAQIHHCAVTTNLTCLHQILGRSDERLDLAVWVHVSFGFFGD
jgi:hypothetical protein